MWPVSSMWDQQIRSGGRRTVHCDIYYNSAVVPVLTDLAVEDYDIHFDRSSDIRSAGTITVAEPELVEELRKNFGESFLEPYGAEVHLSVGVVHNDNTEETVPLGIFGIETTSFDEPGKTATLELVDRMRHIERVAFMGTGVGEGAGRGARDYFQALVDDVYRYLPYTVTAIFDPSLGDYTLPGGYYIGFRPRIDMLKGLIECLGAEFYFDREGQIRVVPVPYVPESATAGDADWIIDAGASGVLVTAKTSVSRKDTFNRITVYGQPPDNTSAAPFADVYDASPGSPTYYFGPFGRADHNFERQEITTHAQCVALANSTLNNSKGLGRTIDLNSIANPALEPGDTILVRHLDGREELHLVDGFSINKSGAMNIQTRSQLVV